MSATTLDRKPAAPAQEAPAGPPLILHARSGAATPDRATSLGFDALGLAPFGAATGALGDMKGSMDALREAASGTDLRVIVDLPWHAHAEGSPLRDAHEDWLVPAGDHAALDPRGAEAGDARALSPDAPVDGVAAWFAETAAALAEAGAGGVRLAGLHRAPTEWWPKVVAAIREAAPGLMLIGDALGGPFEALRAADAADFDALLDSSAWWDGQADWALTQRASLSTPLIAFPEGPDSDDLAARAGGAPIQSLAVERTARALLMGDGLLVTDTLLAAAGEGYASALSDLLAFRRKNAWLAAKGPVLTAAGGALVRLDADPRRAGRGVALAPGGARGPALTAAGGRFDGARVVADAGEACLLTLTPRAAADDVPAEAASEETLRALAPHRVAIENPYPTVDGGRFPAKRIVGDALMVAADVFCDGHEVLAADLLLFQAEETAPVRVPMIKGQNDRWSATGVLSRMGTARFRIEAWRDAHGTWLSEVTKKRAAGQDVSLEVVEGTRVVRRGLEIAAKDDLSHKEAQLLDATRAALAEAGEDTERLLTVLTNPALEHLLRRHGERTQPTATRDYAVTVDRQQARFSSWYEMFPRSQSGDANRHGTFDDVIEKLPYVRDLGFDVLYFPPIHPIGRTNMKGRNNTLTPGPDDVGSPYAIGSKEGGHDAVHPELGTLEDFGRLVEAAADYGLEIALDFAIQCSPDHPWLKDNPEWFDWRPDGTIKYAENPPKKYEDIVNVHFYRDAIPGLWHALRDVVLFWCERGVRMFRVDNPHTKPYPFWEWMIAEVKAQYPDALFLSEAFTRPKVMKRLAKLGFTQSYTYYTWRNTKHELESYVRELTTTDLREVMNPNFFVNTPDINPVPLQTNNRAAHIARTWLAGTLASDYGLYNGVEIVESTVLPGKEEYLDSEKYEIRVWDMDRPGHIKDDIRLLNRLRRYHPALQDHCTVRFLEARNDQVTWFAKRTPDRSDYLLFGVTFDYEGEQHAEVELPLWEFGLPDDAEIAARDLVTGADFAFRGKWQTITLNPARPYVAFQLFGPREADPMPLYADSETHA